MTAILVGAMTVASCNQGYSDEKPDNHVVSAADKNSNTSQPLIMDTVQSAKQANKAIVDKFFIALETQEFELLNDIFADSAQQLNPYVPPGFPSSFEGRDAIYRQYASLPQNFGRMQFPRTIYGTDDPDFFFVKFSGNIEIKGGGTYQNNYLGTFRLRDGKIIEYTEYFNPIVMAKAFNIQLK